MKLEELSHFSLICSIAKCPSKWWKLHHHECCIRINIRSAIFLLAEFGAWWISLNHLNWNIFNNFICCDLKERFQEGNRNCIVVDSLFILRCVRLKFHLNSFSFGKCLYYKIHFVFVNFLRFNIKRREYHMAIN